MEAPTYLYDTNYGAPLIEGRKSNGKITEFKTGVQVGDFFHIDDLLDFSNEEIGGPIVGESAVNWPNHGTATDSSTITMTETVSCNSSVDGNSSRTCNVLETDEHNPAELCVPCDDLAELEWLSNFVEDSFSTEEAPKAFFAPNFGTAGTDKETQLRPHTTEVCGNGNTSPSSVLDSTSSTRKTPTLQGFSPETPVPGRARSKRSRPPVCNWSSRIVSPTCSASTALENGSTPTTSALSSDSDFFAESSLPTKKPAVKATQGMGLFHKKIKEEHQMLPMRKCMHCATVKTPQWRTGPMGPKTLCNACGVRFKSGRLVPEYRPAASPTFVAAKHSNSHRKVIEMRRQKELSMLRHGHGLKDSEEERDFSDNGDDEDGDAERALEEHHHHPYFVSEDDTYFVQHYKSPSNLSEVENPIHHPLYNF